MSLVTQNGMVYLVNSLLHSNISGFCGFDFAFLLLCAAPSLWFAVLFSGSLQMKYGWDNPTSSSSSLSYCEQVSVEEYERQKMSSSQRALQDLLENIIHDRKMNPRDKKKRLKQVHRYPSHDRDLNCNSDCK